MRRHAWQIGGLMVAVGAIVVLGILAFGRGDNARAIRTTGHPTGTPRATATADLRVAEVQAAARRYVEALERSAASGDAAQVDRLVVPGTQAAGNAGIAASFSRDNHYNFIASRIDYDEPSWEVSVNQASATARLRYSLFGHTADWPSLRPRESDHETNAFQMELEFELHGGAWLVTRSS